MLHNMRFDSTHRQKTDKIRSMTKKLGAKSPSMLPPTDDKNKSNDRSLCNFLNI